ncbi:MAG TPA: preprotein translocase subunit SecG [Candidatus Binatia bacterium]|nr:preprotein translocase subunit SecG [Candidatus Binatia bacterium]
MEVIVLIIHVLVCACLIGLVLLQRSEGGALGMGGGGAGSLMSGRGAADALAKMTSVAGGFFLVTSLSLTFLSGASASSSGRSVFDNFIPSRSAPATTPAPAPAQPEPTRPDPTESSIQTDTQLASAAAPGPIEAAPAPVNATTRAAPITNQPATTQRASVPATQRATTPASTPPRQSAPRSTSTTTAPTLQIPNTSGAISGVDLTDDGASQPESIDVGNGVEAVRRERAGPDQ